jgi:chromosome segregation ATPase
VGRLSSRAALVQALALPLTQRLRRVLDDEPATEAELRSLSEQADAWARTLQAQIQSCERRLRELTADPATPLAEIAGELRRVESLRPELDELHGLLDELETRARELRTGWLLRRASSTNPLDEPLTRSELGE